MTERHVSIQVNLAGALGSLQRALQRSVDLVAFGLQCTETATKGNLELPGAYFQVAPAQNEALDFYGAKAEFPRWVLRNGLRDSIEAVGLFLEEVRNVCALWALWLPGRGAISGADWNARMVEEGRKFHRKGLPDKLTFLEKEYGLEIPTLRKDILGINMARNCLVHRRGIVRRQDLNSPDGLRIHWRRHELRVAGRTGTRTIVPPAVVEAGERLTMTVTQATKAFELGESIAFSSQEFSEVCATLLGFGQTLIKNLEDYGRAKGIRFDQPENANKIGPALAEAQSDKDVPSE